MAEVEQARELHDPRALPTRDRWLPSVGISMSLNFQASTAYDGILTALSKIHLTSFSLRRPTDKLRRARRNF